MKNGNHKINLQPVEILKGKFAVIQVVFKAVSALKGNETYELHIDNLLDKEGDLETNHFGTILQQYGPRFSQLVLKMTPFHL